MTDKLAYLIALNQLGYFSTKKLSILSKLFADLDQFRLLSDNELEQIGLSTNLINHLHKIDWSLVEKELNWSAQPNHHIIPFYNQNYPALLKEIPDPPLLLYIKGELSTLYSKQIAIVGTRKPTLSGLQVTQHLTQALANYELTITSGLAYGIDIKAHETAIANKAKTIAVLANGLYSVYPTRHKKTADAIIEHGGCLVSEFSLATTPRPEFFPRRNRIISGLSQGVLVIEADILSGSLITARHAIEQNREVFAVPGSFFNPMAAGCHQLLKNGAKLVSNIGDIIEELPFLASLGPRDPLPPKSISNSKKLDADHRKLLECMGNETITVDQLAHGLGYPVDKIMNILSHLELSGLIAHDLRGYTRTDYE